MKIIFFGSSKVSIYVLEELVGAGFVPALIVTTPDKPQGRGLTMAPNIVKSWAEQHKIPFISPVKLDSEVEKQLRDINADVFIVASYGKIMPKSVIEMPPHKTLNMHPSLLPLYRGAAPLPFTMLDDAKNTGVTIMRIDEQMDHGPLVAEKKITVQEWPTYEIFEEMMAREGGKLLAQILPDWVAGKIAEKEQDHTRATYTKKTKKEDALLDLSADPYTNFRKIQAYHEWPQAYFMATRGTGSRTSTAEKTDFDKKLRVKVTAASFQDGKLEIEKVVPEGKGEMNYRDFLKGYSVV